MRFELLLPMRRRRSLCRLALLLAAGLPACWDDGLGIVGPPAGGLVFVRPTGGSADLARARLSDGRVVRIARTRDREERWPYWSGIAGRVVFLGRPYGRHPRTDLYLWDPVSGEETSIGRTPRRDERWPTWSPVTPEVALAFKDARGPSGIALYDVESERMRVVARTGRTDFFLRPSFAPDGVRLVAQRRAPAKQMHLWLLGIGREPRRLTRGPGVFDTKARFTPDGRSVIFTRRPSQEGPGDIARLDLSTGEVSLVASLPGADDHSSRQSPAREELVFISDRDGSRDVFLMQLPDGEPRNLTRSPDIDEGAPVWSPDGERLVVLRRPSRAPPGEDESGSASARIAVIDRSGRLIFETPGMMADWMPAWP